MLGKNEGSKALDTEVLTTFCAGCVQLGNDKTKLSTVADCAVNHQGAGGNMESEGVLAIIKEVKSYSLQYTEYLGIFRRFKAYKTVSVAGVYGPGVEISKLECTGHIPKRMG